MASDATEFPVVDNPEDERFEIRVADELAGFTLYRRRPRLIAFIHTEVEPRFEGHGVGSRLIGAALDSVRSEGLAVLPFCPFVRAYIAQHTQYLDLVPADYRAEFGLPAG
jgi:predicted GNAT family acetyltransferase